MFSIVIFMCTNVSATARADNFFGGVLPDVSMCVCVCVCVIVCDLGTSKDAA